MFTFLTRFLEELFDKKKDAKNRNKRDMVYTFYGKNAKFDHNYLFYNLDIYFIYHLDILSWLLFEIR